jgi:outer membrane protein
MKTFLLICAAVVCSVLPAQAELKIGHFDLQRLISLSDAGKQAKDLHVAKAQKYQQEVDARTEKLKKLKESVESLSKGFKQGDPLPAELVEKDKEYGIVAREQQRLLTGFQDELKVYEAELTRKVVDQFAPVLQAYATRHKYDYILRSTDPLAFANEKLDLTDALIKEFNQKGKR